MQTDSSLAKLALQLVQIPSPTGSELEVLRFFEGLAQQHGLSARHLPVDNRRYNLLLSPPCATEQILLTTHIDTVPAGPSPRVEGNLLHGRGTCDAKGIAASMFFALLDLIAAGHRATSLLLVVGEETNSDGALAAAAQLEPRKFFINGEPTEMKFVATQRGVVAATVKSSGKACHSGYPEMGHSATHDLISVLQTFLGATWPSDRIVGETLINIGTIQGGSAANVLAESAEASIMVRVATRAADVVSRLRELAGDKAQLTFKSTSDPQTLFVPEGEPSCVVGYGSDVPHLRSLGTPLMFGPGSILDAHTDHEHVLISDLNTARKKYAEICHSLVQGR